MEEKKYTGRGGWRGGARAKTFRKGYGFRLTAETNLAIDAIASNYNISRSDVIERLIKQEGDSDNQTPEPESVDV